MSYFSCRKIGPIVADLVLLHLEVPSTESASFFSKKENIPVIGDLWSGSVNFLFKHVSTDNYNVYTGSWKFKQAQVYLQGDQIGYLKSYIQFQTGTNAYRC